jgi:hypothetical protein
MSNYIYIGPNISVLGLQKGTLYREPKPPLQLEEIAAKAPLVRCLYISTAYLATAKKNLRTNKNSAESLAYDALTKIAKTIPR